MRTTLNISDALATEAKAQAVKEGRTLTSLIEEALRERLNYDRTVRRPAPLPTWGTPGAATFLVDLTDSEAVWNALDEPDPRA